MSIFFASFIAGFRWNTSKTNSSYPVASLGDPLLNAWIYDGNFPLGFLVDVFFWIDSARQRSDSWGGWAYESFCNVGLWVPVWSLESWDLRWRLSWFLMDFRMFCLHLGLARIPKFHERKGLCDSSLFFSYHWDPLSLLWFVLLHCCF